MIPPPRQSATPVPGGPTLSATCDSHDFAVRDWPTGRYVGTADIAAADPGQWLLVDARPPNRFRGEEPEVDARLGVVPQADPRSGHIPGAVNVPCRSHLTVDGHIASPEVVRSNFAAAGVTDQSGPRVVSYCGAGVTACFDLLAMEHAGLEAGVLYTGSWSAWSRIPRLPVARGQ